VFDSIRNKLPILLGQKFGRLGVIGEDKDDGDAQNSAVSSLDNEELQLEWKIRGSYPPPSIPPIDSLQVDNSVPNQSNLSANTADGVTLQNRR
jgi:hypothetical protein